MRILNTLTKINLATAESIPLWQAADGDGGWVPLSPTTTSLKGHNQLRRPGLFGSNKHGGRAIRVTVARPDGKNILYTHERIGLAYSERNWSIEHNPLDYIPHSTLVDRLPQMSCDRPVPADVQLAIHPPLSPDRAELTGSTIDDYDNYDLFVLGKYIFVWPFAFSYEIEPHHTIFTSVGRVARDAPGKSGCAGWSTPVDFLRPRKISLDGGLHDMLYEVRHI